MEYKLSKGVWKGLKTALGIAGAFVVFAGVSDVTIWGLIETYVRPIIGTMTIGGFIALTLNYVKIKGDLKF